MRKSVSVSNNASQKTQQAGGGSNSLDPMTSQQGPSQPATVEGPSNQSWANRVKDLAERTDSDGFTLVQRKGQKQAKKIVGNKVVLSDNKVNTAPRNVTLFVGRLDLDVTPEDLSNYLSDIDVKNVQCKKLESKNGKTFKSSAFMISCDSRYSNILFNESTWPDGALVREWVFYPKKKEVTTS